MDSNLKCIVLGEANCGRTSLINLFMTGNTCISLKDTQNTRYNVNFLAKLDTLLSDSSEKEEFKKCNNQVPKSNDEYLSYSFKLYDYDMTKSNEAQFLSENELDRPDVLIYCYKSGSRLKENLVKCLKHKWGNIPVVLVSCKSDIIDSTLLHNLSYETTSLKLSDKFKASLHFYCSSVKKYNVDKVFNDSFKLAIRHRIKQMLIERENTLKRSLITESKKHTGSNELMNAVNLLKSSKFFVGFANIELDEEKHSNSFLKSLFTLVGFVLFLFYVITCKYYNSISVNEMNLIKSVLDDSLNTLNTFNSLLTQ